MDEGEYTGYQAVTDGTLDAFSLTLTELEFAASYIVRPYIKVKQGEKVVVMYSDDTSGFDAPGFNYNYYTEERTGNSITQIIEITNLSEIPTDVIIEEVGFFWEEKKENGNRTDVVNLPAENKAVGTLDSNGKFTATASGLKEGVTYWTGFYIKYNGKMKVWDWYEDTTATTPKLEDNQSPDKR